jgi:ASCH domain
VKALCVKQPHAFALIYGHKRIENRTWRTNYRGPLIIHASKAVNEIKPRELDGRWLRIIPEIRPLKATDFGCLYGLVDLTDCVPFERVKGQPYAEGPWCWIVANPRPLLRTPYRGKLQLFDVDDELICLPDGMGLPSPRVG